MTSQPETLVIGGGIVGLACAFHLNLQGRRVRVIHADDLDKSTACGNAGGVAVPEIIPLSGPGLIWKTPKWLLDPLGPLSVHPAYAFKMLPWFWRFWRSGSNDQRLHIADAMAQLMKPAFDDHDHVLKVLNKEHILQTKGTISVYRSEKGFKAARPEWELRRQHGFDYEILDRDGVHHYEPALGPLAQYGYRMEDWAHYRDPAELVVSLADHLKSIGVAFEQEQVSELRKEDGRVAGVRLKSGRLVDADQVIIAAGAWSAEFCQQLGEAVLLETERGYNTTLPNPDVDVRSFVTFSEDYFVMTPMQMGLRIGGAVEFAGLKRPPNYARSKALLKLAEKYLPDLNTFGGTEWMGHRPSTPDTLPVIGPSTTHQNVFYAFGHGHLGLTGSMTTGRLISQLATAQHVNMDLSAFSIARFQ